MPNFYVGQVDYIDRLNELATASAISGIGTSLANIDASVAAAAASATTATNKATTATTQATNAANSATTATTQAGIATTQATNASNSATTATTQAGIATTQATNASASATTATTQASAAAASAAAAALSYDSFDDRYLGNKSSDPTLDNDGATLLTGALYWNTAIPEMRVWNGTAWVAVQATSAATAAAASATTATTQAGIATTQATNASNSATTATTQAGIATTQATNASASATTATTQAGIATTQATNASASAATASTQATNASNSATTATNQASTATTQAGIATTQATNAASSATTATTQAGIATTQATNASASATLAQNWAVQLTTPVSGGEYSAKYWAQYAAATITGSLIYRGSWSAAGGVYPSTPATGDYWKVSVAGTVSSVVYDVNDSIIYNGTTWDKIDSTDAVSSVAGRTGVVVLTKTDVGLANVDNTSDALKPVSSATQTALNLKADLISPSFTTPILGTPQSGVATNLTGLPLTTGVTGVLPTANGGTGLASYTANGVVYASGTGTLASGSALVFDGTNLRVNSGGTTEIGSKALLFYNTGAGDAVIQSADDVSTVTSIGINKTELKFYSSGTERMRLDASGNLGIGVVPTYKLDISAGTVGTTLGNQIITQRLSANPGNVDNLEISNLRVAAGIDWRSAGWRLQEKVDSTWMGYIQFNGNNDGGISFGTGASTTSPGSIVERVRIDGSGNLGVGVTPSAWNTGVKALQVGTGSMWASAENTYFGSNYYYAASNRLYSSNGYALEYLLNANDGSYRWYTAPSGTAGNAITFTQAMTLDASGNLNIANLTASKPVFTDASKNLTSTGTVPVVNGGTGLSTIAALSIPVANTLNTYSTVTPTAGQSIRINAGATAWEAYTPAAGGTVTSVSVVSANGFAGTVATATTTPAITLSTSITGVIKGNGTAISAATAGTDYVTPTGSETLTNKTVTGVKETNVALGANNIDLSTGNYFTKTITGATTLTVSNVPASGTVASFIFNLTNGGAGAITWWSGMKWAGGVAPTLTVTGRDALGFYTHDGGTTWTGLVLGKDVK